MFVGVFVDRLHPIKFLPHKSFRQLSFIYNFGLKFISARRLWNILSHNLLFGVTERLLDSFTICSSFLPLSTFNWKFRWYSCFLNGMLLPVLVMWFVKVGESIRVNIWSLESWIFLHRIRFCIFRWCIQSNVVVSSCGRLQWQFSHRRIMI